MIPQMLSNTNLFVDGVSFAGDVPSLTLPKLTVKTEAHRGGGMAGEIEMDVGLEKLEASWTTTGVRRESLKYFGLSDQTGCNAVFRGAFKGLKGQITPVIATMRGSEAYSRMPTCGSFPCSGIGAGSNVHAMPSGLLPRKSVGMPLKRSPRNTPRKAPSHGMTALL